MRAERRVERERQELAADIAERWRWVLQGTAAARNVTNGAGVQVTTAPVVVGVDLGQLLGPIVLTVRMLAGQVPEDLVAVAGRIAEGMGCAAVRIRPWRPGYVRVFLLRADPLGPTLALDLRRPGVLVGLLEHGEPLRVDPVDLPHLMVQGQTRSGKSTWLYALLAQLVRDRLVRVAGVDPSGLTLRPFTGTAHAAWQTTGLADLAAAEATLARLVEDVDARLAAMPLDRDVLAVDEAHPLTVVVLEEYPALLRALDAADAKQGKRVRALVARLLAESHKVGHRVVIAAQRAEAQIVGAAERAQCGGRLTFRVDSLDTVKLLHPDGDVYAAEHTAAPPGVALCTWPGSPLQRLRGPIVGGYREYVQAIRSAA
jgi:S-DNA-T family DNA segregation ATPase FtsK/SpoIIIE